MKLAILLMVAVAPAGLPGIVEGQPITKIESEAKILTRIDTIAQQIKKQNGVLDAMLRERVVQWFRSVEVRRVVKARQETSWLTNLTSFSVDKVRSALPADTAFREFIVDVRLSVHPVHAPRGIPCDSSQTNDTITISGRVAAYVGDVIFGICGALTKLAADTVTLDSAGVVRLNSDRQGTFRVQRSRAESRLHRASCPGGTRSGDRPETEKWVSTMTSRTIRSRLDSLCHVVATVASSQERAYDLLVVIQNRKEPVRSDSALIILRQEMSALRLLRDVLEYQIWRHQTSDPVEAEGDPSPHTRQPRAGVLAGFDTGGGVQASVAGRIKRVIILGGVRKVPDRAGTLVELGIGPTPGSTTKPFMFGTCFYDTEGDQVGLGLIGMPFTWKRLRMGAGVSTNGVVSARLGFMPPR